jgi:hypothetical protein
MYSPPVCVWCACGAKYERRDVRLPIKDIGVYECLECGDVLARWSGRVVPAFRPIGATKAPAAA